LAGHPPPLLRSADGAITELGEPGTMLGYVEDPDLTLTPVNLATGDTLLLYTDGLTESAPPRSNHAQLRNWLCNGSADDLDVLLAHLENHAVNNADGRPRDDIALLALQATPSNTPPETG
jgi:serine phosphatase RsbU (regulator of sigma subunit)